MDAEWSSLSSDLLELILPRLGGHSDYVRFGTVCRGWFRVFMAKRCNLAEDQLWIWANEDGAGVFYFPSEQRWCRHLRLPIVLSKWNCCGSQHGWLAFARDLDFSGCRTRLINPLSGAQVILPELKSPRFCSYLDKFCCSLPPDDPKCVVVYIQFFGGFMAIRIERSTKWVTYQRHHPDEYASAIFYKGTLYVARSSGDLCVVDLDSCEPGGRPEIWTIFSWQNESLHWPSLTLIEHRGELLLCCLAGAYERTLPIPTFQIYKANLELQRWEPAGTWQAERQFAGENFELMPIITNQMEESIEVDVELGSKVVLYHFLRRDRQLAMLWPRPWSS